MERWDQTDRERRGSATVDSAGKRRRPSEAVRERYLDTYIEQVE